MAGSSHGVNKQCWQCSVTYIFVELNECASNPCMNGGVCIDQINAFVCICRQLWEGTRCEIRKYICKQFDLFSSQVFKFRKFLMQLTLSYHMSSPRWHPDGMNYYWFQGMLSGRQHGFWICLHIWLSPNLVWINLDAVSLCLVCF